MKAQSIEEYEPKENKCICCPFLFYLKHCKHNIFPVVLCTFLFCMLVCTHSDVPNADNYYFCFFKFAVNHLPYCLFFWWISNIFLSPISYIYFLFLYFYFISFVLAKCLHVYCPVLSPFLGSPFLHEFHHCPSSLLHPHPLCKCNARKLLHKNSSLNISISTHMKNI